MAGENENVESELRVIYRCMLKMDLQRCTVGASKKHVFPGAYVGKEMLLSDKNAL